jgi:hypothetical protein
MMIIKMNCIKYFILRIASSKNIFLLNVITYDLQRRRE